MILFHLQTLGAKHDVFFLEILNIEYLGNNKKNIVFHHIFILCCVILLERVRRLTKNKCHFLGN